MKSKFLVLTVPQLLFQPVMFYANIYLFKLSFEALKEHGEHKMKDVIQKEIHFYLIFVVYNDSNNNRVILKKKLFLIGYLLCSRHSATTVLNALCHSVITIL